MSFYKLYSVIHRRTDYYKLYRLVREMLFPEYYEERRKRARAALNNLLSASVLTQQWSESQC